MSAALTDLNNKIIKCNLCERLVEFRNKISKEKRKQYIDEIYWGNQLLVMGILRHKY
tara:strand:+ start:903 stop:1073 length:171 start_codon:yes stop_codon:yes gene_type:complete